jgi:hypothetical protein
MVIESDTMEAIDEAFDGVLELGNWEITPVVQRFPAKN